MPNANNIVLEQWFIKTDRIEYKYWDKVEFAFTDEDLEFTRWIWILNAPFWNYESCDFSIDDLEIITWWKYKDLHIFRKDIIQFFITAKSWLRWAPCKTLWEAKEILRKAILEKWNWWMFDNCYIANSLWEIVANRFQDIFDWTK